VPHLHAGDSRPGERLPISPSTLATVQRALARTVTRGTGGRSTTGEFTVAGKTGTAQVYKRSAGIDANDLPKAERDHAWFAGYAPAVDPQVAFAVVVEHGGHGGETAAPIAREVLSVYFSEAKTRPEVAPADDDVRAAVPGGSGEASDVRTPSAR